MQTQIKKISFFNIRKAKKIILSGGLIGMPTETVYGLGANGLNPNAVKEIFKVKGRPTDNPLIAHVHKNYDISKLVVVEQDYVYKLIKLFMPGPLTLVLKSKGVVCKEAVCGGSTLAIRMPSHKGCQKFLKAVNLPIVAPSANLSKHTSPVTAKQVYNDLYGFIPLILDGGKCQGGIESTVLDVTEKTPRILRAGLITKEMIEQAVGSCEIAEHKEGDKVTSPGVKYKHYKPRCETALFPENQIDKAIELYKEYENNGKKPYIMCKNGLKERFSGLNVLLLGNNEHEIASSLYDTLLTYENVADVIIAIEMPNETGVYLGIMNRLRKSCG
jgi:L-threonylcarbamoyladenylate synthase